MSALGSLSCVNNDMDPDNFYGKHVRIGAWINEDLEDTLNFVDDSHLIRKGNWPGEFTYRIEGDLLMVTVEISGQKFESSNQISAATDTSVTLSGMIPYLTYTSPLVTYVKQPASLLKK